MSIAVDIEQLDEFCHLPMIDVRSPSEFVHGHIPIAENVPLFDDDERAEVGTLYKQRGRDPAIARGFEIVGSKTEALMAAARQFASGSDIVVHCWRGGMRSAGVAWLLEQNGFRPRVIEGGYKAFRRHVRQSLAAPHPIVLLGGHTGAGKTELLERLRQAGEQVIDLEGLAGHRGSAFGGLGKPPQPTVEQFENDLYWLWRELDPKRIVWIEGESKSIGRVYLPDELWRQMCNAPAVFVEVPQERRVEFLLREYGELPKEELAAAVNKIKKRLGGDRLQAALQALERDNLAEFTQITLQYYDKAYANALTKRPRNRVVRLSMEQSGDPSMVDKLRDLATDLAGPRQIGPAERC